MRALRAEIVQGKLAPDSQLPSHPELARRFGVSPVTIGLAINNLARDGFLQARHRLGTFVTPKPPHLSRYALVFWNDPVAPHAHCLWSRYYSALSQEAMRLRSEGHDLEIYHGVDEHADSEDRQRLIARIESHRLAGLIFCNTPFLVENTPILDSPGVPRVAITNDTKRPDIRAVSPDGKMWLGKALDYVTAAGRRRVAILSFGFDEARQRDIHEALAERGLACPDHWWQDVNPHSPLAARNCASLLMFADQKVRPDALLILDDNLAEGALAGLLASGVRVPGDVVVVAHANFPWVPTRVVPVKWLGYDVRHLLRTAMDLIDRERRGESVPASTVLPALFEEELSRAARTSFRPIGSRR